MTQELVRALRVTAILVLLVTSAALATDSPIVEKPDVNTVARPIERSPPSYPTSPLKRGQEGWVVVSYVVQPDGTVADPIVIDSSGVEEFEEAALKTVLRWTFQPATQGGQPVQQCETQTQLTFALKTSERGARQKFLKRYRKINKLLESGDIEQAEALLDETVEMGEWNLYEYSRLWLLRSFVANARGDNRAQLQALKRAFGKEGSYVEKNLASDILAKMLLLELTLSEYSAAIATYEEMKKKRTKSLDEYEPLIDAVHQVIAIVESEDILLTPAQLSGCSDCEGQWTYKPLRRAFEFANIVGTLEELELRCDWRLYRHDIAEDLSWGIPDSWGDCQLHVYGASGTTFNFLELPQ